MIIIGHRGAAGMAPENTISAIKAAVKEGVDMIEFDIRATKDNHLIVFHDPNLLRIAGVNRNISDMTLKEINATATHSGHPIPRFQDALKAAGSIPIFIDGKGKNWAPLLHAALLKHKGPQPSVTAKDTNELVRLHHLSPHLDTFVCEYVNPFVGIYKARVQGLSGINMSVWILNPLVYLYARHHKLKCTTFTVNYPFVAKFVHRLYPEMAIITNVPHKLAPLARRRNEKPRA